ncbi:MAG: DNA-3-methyladenine glycosylase I [Nannocystaceae bacterium]|nr:DNA-3-methyladenine glycosylase I [Nannocystaceae bacterium]
MTLYRAPDGKNRCMWAGAAPGFLAYHDTEWGFPVDDDQRLFEKLCLEGFQSGLSWRTILTKRENFRAAFANFEIDAVARFNSRSVDRLLGDAGIIRHRGKIEAAINNAKRAQELIAETGSLAAYAWSFEPDPASLPEPQTLTTSEQSKALSKDLKRRGWKFVGPTTMFAFMQAMGLVNDHSIGCVVRSRVAKARTKFSSPAK